MTPLACRVWLPSLLPSFQKLSAAVLSCAGIELNTADRDTGTTAVRSFFFTPASSRVTRSFSVILGPFVGNFLHCKVPACGRLSVSLYFHLFLPKAIVVTSICFSFSPSSLLLIRDFLFHLYASSFYHRGYR